MYVMRSSGVIVSPVLGLSLIHISDRGYIAYKGYISMEEVMNGGQSNHMVMGGLSQ